MDLDEDEEVPALVVLGTQKVDEDDCPSTTAKVPLTIVTGMYFCIGHRMRTLFAHIAFQVTLVRGKLPSSITS